MYIWETIMKYPVSSIWQSPPDNLEKRIELCIEEAITLRETWEPVTVFAAP